MTSRIVVVGGGPVGLSFAIAAAQLPGASVTVIERAADGQRSLPSPFDHRVYALSPTSMQFLADLGVVPDPARAAPVRSMRVCGDQAGSQLDFTDGQPLATIVEHASLMRALESRQAQVQRIVLRRGVTAQSLDSTEHGERRLALADGSELTADLLVAADGSRSQIRQLAAIAVDVRDYDSDGVVANFRCERAHGDIARQWFGSDSVLAYLPLPGKHISMVWSMASAAAAQTAALDRDQFCAAVAAAGHHQLGSLALVSPIERFPLARTTAQNWVQPGLALIGDAAHAVHPLAGQGVNLGFADARKLVEVLGDRSKFSRAGDFAVLRHYERARREAALAVGQVTDRLRSLYLSEWSLARWLRNDGVRMVNRLPLAKSVLVDYATR